MDDFRSAEARLITSFVERDISVDVKEVESIFDEDGDRVTWALEHLSSDTLLSKEELLL